MQVQSTWYISGRGKCVSILVEDVVPEVGMRLERMSDGVSWEVAGVERQGVRQLKPGQPAGLLLRGDAELQEGDPVRLVTNAPAPLVTAWSCEHGFVASVQALELGSGFTVVFVDFNRAGKRAGEAGGLAPGGISEENYYEWKLRGEDGREATLRLALSEPAQSIASQSGRYAMWAVLRRSSTELRLGTQVPERPKF